MAERTIIGFDDPNHADCVATEPTRPRRDFPSDLKGDVIATRRPDGAVRIKEGIDPGSGSFHGAGWNSLIGFPLLDPLAGRAIGGAVGAGSGVPSGNGIYDGIDGDNNRAM